MKKRLPKLKTDKEAEDFLDQDLSEYLEPENFTETLFEIQPKDKSVTLRMSSDLLDAYKDSADEQGVSYQKLMRQALEKFLKKKSAS
jgi:predicted DNA binding CopG/RHH family protein